MGHNWRAQLLDTGAPQAQWAEPNIDCNSLPFFLSSGPCEGFSNSLFSNEHSLHLSN